MPKELKNCIKEYHGDTGSLSKTGLSMILDRPRRYWKYYLAPQGIRESFEASKAQREGDAVHCLVLEPDQWNCRYYVADVKSRATKGFKEASAINLDKITLTTPEFDHIRRMADSLLNDKTAAKYLSLSGEAEKSFYWDYRGVSLKCRPDRITKDFCIDIKTTRDVGKRAFMYDADKYHYFLSAGMTLSGVEAVRGYCPEAYVFLCVENSGDKSPDVACYYTTPSGAELGEYQLNKAIDRYLECKELNHWPAVSAQTEPLDPPAYRIRQLEKAQEALLTEEYMYAS